MLLRRAGGERKADLLMFPGLRFVVVALVLTMAVVTFGVGAAALLRASRQVAAAPPWQPLQPVLFVGRDDAAAPTLSLLRIETPPPAETVAEPSAAGPEQDADAAGAEAGLPPPPEPVVRDVTADVLAALPAPPAGEPMVVASAPSVAALPEEPAGLPSPPEPVVRDVTADVLAALPAPPAIVPAPAAAEEPRDPAVAAPSVAAAVAETIEAVPGAEVAHPPLPRPRPQARVAANRAASAARRRAVARSRAAARPAAVAPQPDPFASFAQPPVLPR